jgi:hypothetical protein
VIEQNPRARSAKRRAADTAGTADAVMAG